MRCFEDIQLRLEDHWRRYSPWVPFDDLGSHYASGCNSSGDGDDQNAIDIARIDAYPPAARFCGVHHHQMGPK